MSLTTSRQFKQVRGAFGGFGVDDAAMEFWSVVALMVASDDDWKSGFFLGIENNAGCSVNVM